MDLPFVVPDPPQPGQASVFSMSDASTDCQPLSLPLSQKIPSRQEQHPQQIGPSLTQLQNGGLLYDNLVPGHYRYGAMPPQPPPGPLSLKSSGSSHHSHAQHAMRTATTASEQTRPQHTTMSPYSNVSNYHPSHQSTQASARQVLQVSEPDEDDDDLLVIAASDMMDAGRDDDDDDDEKMYRPFRHASSSGSNGIVCNAKVDRPMSNSTHSKDSSKLKNKPHYKDQPVVSMNTKPIDLLTVLISGSAHENAAESDNINNAVDLSTLIEDATTKSRNARALTDTLATKQNATPQATHEQMIRSGAENDLYVNTASAHTEAAVSFQRVYRALLGLGNDHNPTSVHSIIQQQKSTGGLSPSEEIAKSMLILANGHVRMAASLANMGVKWNMGKVESFGRVISKDSKQEIAAAVSDGPENIQAHTVGATSNGLDDKNHNIPQHERLRMAVRGALDTANHEEDITNSTFLARSTFLRAKSSDRRGKSSVGCNPDAVGSGGNIVKGQVAKEVNAVDDLMKLEEELKGMDMALEVGTSVCSLGAAVSSRPDGSFCVVPPRSSYMSSSFMWSSGVMGVMGGGNPPLPQQQQQQYKHHDRVSLKPTNGSAGIRSRANHLQNFLGGSRPSTNPHPLPPTTPIQSNQKIDQATANAGLDQSWWGGGQGSMMASVALSTVTASHQKSSPHHVSNPTYLRAESANTKQLMQLMDSLNRLGNENAQLMREVEEAKAARAEAVAAKNMMEQFKKEYNQRFLKVKEALEKYPRNASDHPVYNSSYIQSASMMELQKRDQIIKKLAADLRKEREETKKKDAALRKYEGFYREVKARSAEKARQRQLQEEQKKPQHQQQG